jgi:hypothetical protein
MDLRIDEDFDREEALDRLDITRRRPNETGFQLDARGLPIFPFPEPEPAPDDPPLIAVPIMRRLRAWIPGLVRWR